MSYPQHEAPRELVAILWSIAGIIAIFLAISVSSLFFLKYYFPVDASEVTAPSTNASCPNGAEVSINNYPGQANITKYVPGSSDKKTDEVVKPLGGLFQCSKTCIPGLTAGAVDSATKTKVAEYLNGGSIAGKPIVVVDDGEAFMKKFLEWQKEKNADKQQFLADDLKRTVILSQTKPTCQGPRSTEYAEPIIGKDGQKVEITEPNNTVKQAEQAGRTENAPTGALATGAPIQPETAVQGDPATEFQAPAGGGGMGGSKKINYKQKLNDCKVEIAGIHKKYDSKATGNFKEKLSGYYRQYQEDFLKQKFSSDQVAYEKCVKFLTAYHELLDKHTGVGRSLRQAIDGALGELAKDPDYYKALTRVKRCESELDKLHDEAGKYTSMGLLGGNILKTLTFVSVARANLTKSETMLGLQGMCETKLTNYRATYYAQAPNTSNSPQRSIAKTTRRSALQTAGNYTKRAGRAVANGAIATWKTVATPAIAISGMTRGGLRGAINSVTNYWRNSWLR